MKRELFDNVKVFPNASGVVIDREGFLSAVIGADIGAITGSPTTASLAVKVEHCDTAGGTFVAAPDSRLDPEHVTTGGILKTMEVSSKEVVNLNLDLVGCKRYIKITPTITFTGGSTPKADDASYAVVLGDPAAAPV